MASIWHQYENENESNSISDINRRKSCEKRMAYQRRKRQRLFHGGGKAWRKAKKRRRTISSRKLTESRGGEESCAAAAASSQYGSRAKIGAGENQSSGG
jgi:hypothetical protein